MPPRGPRRDDPPPPAEVTFRAIGWVSCAEYHVYEAARQGVLGGDNRAQIHLYDDERRLGETLEGLAGFERLWVLSELHLSQTWRQKVAPPRAGAGKLGVFATRAPHRPNRLGLTCVRLLGLDGLTLDVAEHDFLHRTPVLDLKPYLPYADSFPDAAIGWLAERPLVVHRVVVSDRAAARLDAVESLTGLAARAFVHVQLSTEPTEASRKRITPARGAGEHVIAYRTWRIRYRVSPDAPRVDVLDVTSGYTDAELADPADRHGDKGAHRDFLERFGRDLPSPGDI